MRRALGQTGMLCSPLGLGTVKFGRQAGLKYPTTFHLPSDAEICNLLALARELGINLVDTAPAYGNSEQRLGLALRGQRQHWCIVSKVGEEFVDGSSHFDFRAAAVRASIQRSLQRLQTDYLDVVLAHSSGTDLQHIQEDAVFASLAECKQAGYIRAFGMSSKTVAGGLATVEAADVVMVTFNAMDQSQQPVLARAATLRKGVLIKKPLASGHIVDVATNLQSIAAEAAVSSIIVGTLNPEHLRLAWQAVNR
jgi:aryl-alcohol dehydrogenase-like predicted oxidoreductase